MRKTTRILLWVLAALMAATLVFTVPSGSMLSDYQDQWIEFAWDSGGLLRLMLPDANAE
ncbi:MAG: hypothetical protein IJ214_13325 [Clostridia bacterium]|nr:hypothetical protein [Clostridia bacterium]